MPLAKWRSERARSTPSEVATEYTPASLPSMRPSMKFDVPMKSATNREAGGS